MIYDFYKVWIVNFLKIFYLGAKIVYMLRVFSPVKAGRCL